MANKHPSALKLIAAVFATLLTPPAKTLPSEWAAQNLVVPDGPKAGENWSAELTPYIVEPLDALAPDSGVNKVVVRKSTQSGFTLLGIAFTGHSIDTDPCRMMVVQPTDSALTEFNHEKLGEAIKNSPALRRKVSDQKSRSADGSSTYRKKFPGGSLTLAIATSTADLRSKTVKKVFKDETSEYPADLGDQGSPHAMIEARYESFLRTGDWKELNVSTPVIKGECHIDAEFEKGDQRYWHVTCPRCGSKFRFEFDRKYFKFNEAYPYDPVYFPPCCGGEVGSEISEQQKYELVRKGEWIAVAPGPGKFRSYHFDAMSSVFVPWSKIVERFLLAGEDPAKLKTFTNLTLGLAYEMKGDAPDWEMLLKRAQDYPAGVIPPQGLLLVAACDVQMKGIYVEVLALGPDAQSWVVEAKFLPGETDDVKAGAWEKLTAIYDRQWPDSFGKTRRVDAFGVDSGYRSHAVYTWCRARPGAFALDGRDGWTRPAIGTPQYVDVDYGGKKIKNGATIYAVGTWSLKATIYSNLRKQMLEDGVAPAGFCHFHRDLDEVYFRQMTAEYLATEMVRGVARRKWKTGNDGDNHFLDCRVYNMALADYLGLTRMSPADWQELARDRGAPPIDDGLFAPVKLAAREEQTPQVRTVEPPSPPRRDNWLKGYKVNL